jgi:hypothetical protein
MEQGKRTCKKNWDWWSFLTAPWYITLYIPKMVLFVAPICAVKHLYMGPTSVFAHPTQIWNGSSWNLTTTRT